MTLSKKVATRLSVGIKRFVPILNTAKSRDLNESDTVTIITDMLSEIFGYDKYTEVTSEYAIRGTYCDLAIKIDDKIELLIEAKAINAELKDAFVKQATDYAANKGIEWVILTNGEIWRAYKISFGKPIGQELIFEFNFSKLNSRNDKDLEMVFLLSKEGWLKSVIDTYHNQKQALSKFILGAMLLSEPIISALKKEIKKLSPNVKVNDDEIHAVLKNEVIKREVFEGENYEEAKKKVSRLTNKPSKAKIAKKEVTDLIQSDILMDKEPFNIASDQLA